TGQQERAESDWISRFGGEMSKNYPGSGKIRRLLGRENSFRSGTPNTAAIKREAEKLIRRGKTRQVAYNLARKKLKANPREPGPAKFVPGGRASPRSTKE